MFRNYQDLCPKLIGVQSIMLFSYVSMDVVRSELKDHDLALK